MGAPPLPPPPGAEGWLNPTSPASAGGRSLLDRPAWRQGRPGWALLHLAIGLGIAIGGVFVSAIIGVIGRTQAQIDNADDGPSAIGTLLVLGSSVVGWFLFAYLGWSLGRRWAILGLLVGGSVAVAGILFSVATR
jgi:hypothetical protein